MYKQGWLLLVIVWLGACSSTHQSSDAAPTLLKARYGHVAVSDGQYLYNIAGSGRRGWIADAEVFDPVSGKQWQLTKSVLPRRYFSAVYDGHHSVYLLGGHLLTPTGVVLADQVEQLDLKTGVSVQVSTMPHPSADVSAVRVGDEILMFGGTQAGQGIATAQAWQPQTNRWRLLQPMPVARATRAVVHQGMVYLVGGFDGKQALTRFERYDPATDTYQILPPLPQKISAHSASVLNNSLWVFGDYAQQHLSYRYDFGTRQWQKTDLGYLPARHTASAVLGDTVYVTGGNNDAKGSYLDHIQRFRF